MNRTCVRRASTAVHAAVRGAVVRRAAPHIVTLFVFHPQMRAYDPCLRLCRAHFVSQSSWYLIISRAASGSPVCMHPWICHQQNNHVQVENARRSHKTSFFIRCIMDGVTALVAS
eukprot:330706-Pleurochrysis_carterae.AAC.3